MKTRKFRKVVKYPDEEGEDVKVVFWISFILSIVFLPITMIFAVFYLWHHYWFKQREVYFEEIK